MGIAVGKLLAINATVAIGLLGLVPQAVLAGGTTKSCASMDTSLGGAAYIFGEELSIVTVATGNQLTITYVSGSTAAFYYTSADSTRISLTLPQTLTAAAGISKIGIDATGTLKLSCIVSPSTTGSSAGSIGGTSQTDATGNGITANTEARFGDGGVGVTSNSLFLSSQGAGNSALANPDWNAWINLEASAYSGGLTGTTFDTVIGIDRMINNDLLVGMLFGYGQVNIVENGVAASSVSPAIGVYFAARGAGTLIFDGFVTGARPTTTTEETSFTGTRDAAGFNVSGTIENNGNSIKPFLHARGFVEVQPAYTGSSGAVAANLITSYTVSAGTRLNFGAPLANTNLRPYVSAALDYSNQTSTANGSDVFFYPRAAVGISGETKEGGSLHFGVDGGKSLSDVFDFGATFEYSLKF